MGIKMPDKAKTKTVSSLLYHLSACGEAIEAHGNQTLTAAWRTCERGDWMLWLCAKMEGEPGWPTREDVVLAVCECVEPSLKFITDSVALFTARKAIDTARAWAHGKSTQTEVIKSSAACYASTYAVDAAASAAHAAAYTTYVSLPAYSGAHAYASHAAFAAAGAYYAARGEDARSQSLAHSADICRKLLYVPQ